MLVRTLNLPTDPDLTETGYTDVPDWLKPYLAAAIRSGLTTGLTTADGFGPDLPVTAEEAAAMLCSALQLEPQEQTVLSSPEGEAFTPVEVALQNGFDLIPGQTLTRSDCASLLYQTSQYREGLVM